MAETDILNPVKGYWDILGDSPTWDFDYTRKKAINKAETSSRLGAPYSRDIGNAGHSFAWNWTRRPLATMQRLEHFYEQFKHGYFTVIDWDNGGRHYVGRFMEPPYPQETANLTWAAQGVQFQEIPGARMLQYPNNWDKDSYYINVVDDFLNPLVYQNGSFGVRQTPAAVAAGRSVNDPTSYEFIFVSATAGIFAQAQYVGWGFRQLFRKAANLGIVDVQLDGVRIIEGLDLYAGTAVATGPAIVSSNPPVSLTVTGAAGAGDILVRVTDVPLDQHRVKVVATGTKNAGSTATTAIYPRLQVMY